MTGLKEMLVTPCWIVCGLTITNFGTGERRWQRDKTHVLARGVDLKLLSPSALGRFQRSNTSRGPERGNTRPRSWDRVFRWSRSRIS